MTDRIPEWKERGVVYPRRCEGVCKIGDFALNMVDGVLAGKCDGPRHFGTDVIALAHTEGEIDFAVSTEDDLDRLACQNPRLVKAVRAMLDRQLDAIVRNPPEDR